MKSKSMKKNSYNKKKSQRKIKGRMGTKKRMYRNKKYGGVTNPFMTSSPYGFANKVDCSNMNVDGIQNMKELHTRYQKCCPKNMFGYKNSSSICKKMEQKFNNLWTVENNSHGHYGYENTPTITP